MCAARRQHTHLQLFNFVVDRAAKNPALADTISSMFTDLDLRARLKRPGFYWDLLLGR